VEMPEGDRRRVFELNTRHVYPRLDRSLRARGS
jgi:hypothetical protein